MKLSSKGIGWLIFGALVCWSATEADGGIPGIASTIAIGLVFIAIYFMKQRFDPGGIGWFVAGGILLAFCLEEALNVMNGFISRFSILPGDLSDMFIGFLAAVGCMYMFYRRNKSELEDAAFDAGMGDDFSFPYQEQVFRETAVEETKTVVETGPVVPGFDDTPSDEETVVEIDVTDGE